MATDYPPNSCQGLLTCSGYGNCDGPGAAAGYATYQCCISFDGLWPPCLNSPCSYGPPSTQCGDPTFGTCSPNFAGVQLCVDDSECSGSKCLSGFDCNGADWGYPFVKTCQNCPCLSAGGTCAPPRATCPSGTQATSYGGCGEDVNPYDLLVCCAAAGAPSPQDAGEEAGDAGRDAGSELDAEAGNPLDAESDAEGGG